MKGNQIVLVVVSVLLFGGIVIGSFVIGRLTASEGETLSPINRPALETEIIATYQAGGSCGFDCQQQTLISPTGNAISTDIAASATALIMQPTTTPGQ